MIRLRERQPDLEEMMDRDDCDAAALERTYRAFVHINRWLSGWGWLYSRHMRPILLREAARRAADGPTSPARDNTIRIVDVGCGGGDVLRYVVGRARRDGLAVTGLGVDPDGRAIRYARAASGSLSMDSDPARSDLELALSFQEGRLEDVTGPVDVILSNHLLHHLSDDAVRDLLAASVERAAALSIHNDIARSWPALVLFQAVRPLFPRTFVGVDGTRSIQRSFTAQELAVLAGPTWRPVAGAPFRAALLHVAPGAARGPGTLF